MKPSLILFVSLAGLVIRLSAQNLSDLTVSGEVVGPQNVSLSQLRVQVFDSGEHARVMTVPVQSDGRFELRSIKPGRYEVSVVNERDQELQTDPAVQIGQMTGTLTLRLPESKDEKPASGSVSVQHLLHHAPANAVKAFRHSQQAARDGNSAAAIDYLRKSLAADPDFFEAHVNLGAAYMGQNDVRRAAEEFQEALRIDGSSVTAWVDLAIVQLRLGDPTRAEQSAEHALQIDPSSDHAHYGVAIRWIAQRRFSPQLFEHLEAAYPQYPHARLIAAQVLHDQGRLVEARAQLEAYLKLGNVPDRDKVNRYLKQIDEQAAMASRRKGD